MPQSIKHDILNWNKEQAALYAANSAQRQEWFKIHSTRWGALKCMDGRVNLPVVTETPLGIFRPWRDMGGKFEIGQLSFSESLKSWLVDIESGSREAGLLVSYHWSAGDPHRGCRGFDYNLDQAKAGMEKLRNDISRVFRGSRLFPILIGLETDSDALVVHGTNGEMFDIRSVDGSLADNHTFAIQSHLARLFPSMTGYMAGDLASILEGNRRHVLKVKAEGRSPEELKHCEKVLAFGQGFDWIHGLNQAFIVGPFNDNKVLPVITAAKLLIANKAEGRIKNDKVVLLVCMPHTTKLQYYQTLAQERALHLAKIALEGIRRELPDQADFFVPMVCTINMENRVLEEIDLTKMVEFAEFLKEAA